MKRLLCSVAAVAALGWGTAGVAQAAPVDINVYTSAGLSISGSGSNSVTGTLTNGSSALSYASDYFDFFLTPSGGSGTVSVDDLADFFPNESWELNTLNGPIGSGTGINTVGVYGGAANGPPENVALSFDQNYQIALQSDAPTNPRNQTSANVTITSSNALGTPLPGALALFVGGLGLLGFAGTRKRSKAPRGLRLNVI